MFNDGNFPNLTDCTTRLSTLEVTNYFTCDKVKYVSCMLCKQFNDKICLYCANVCHKGHITNISTKVQIIANKYFTCSCALGDHEQHIQIINNVDLDSELLTSNVPNCNLKEIFKKSDFFKFFVANDDKKYCVFCKDACGEAIYYSPQYISISRCYGRGGP